MKRLLVDTNVLLSFLTDRNERQQAAASRIFEKAVRGECKLICHLNVAIEFVYVLDKVYGRPKSEVRELLGDFLALPCVEPAEGSDVRQALQIWPAGTPDFGDAILLACLDADSTLELCSFDAGLRKRATRRGCRVCRHT